MFAVTEKFPEIGGHSLVVQRLGLGAHFKLVILQRTVPQKAHTRSQTVDTSHQLIRKIINAAISADIFSGKNMLVRVV